MSRTEQRSYPVLEWSPGAVTLFDPQTKTKTEANSIGLLLPQLKGAKEVVVALTRRTSFIRTTHLPNASKEDVARILQLQIGQLVPIQASELASDFMFTDEIGAEGRLAVVVAAAAEVLRQLHRELQESGLEAVAIVPAALGASLAAKQLGVRDGAMVHQTAEGVCIDVLSHGQLRATRVVPLSDPNLIDGEVCRSFTMAKLPCSDSVGLGGFSFPGVDRVTDVSPLAQLSHSPFPLSLELPETVAKRLHEKVERKRRLALLLWVATFGVAAVIWDIRSSAQEAVAADNLKYGKALRTMTSAQSQAETKLNGLNKTASALKTAFQPKQRLGDVLAILSSLSPPNLWLTGVTLDRGKPVQLRGTATNGDAVTDFLENLSKETRFRDAKLVFANNGLIEATNVVQFSISAHVVGNFPAFEADTRKKK